METKPRRERCIEGGSIKGSREAERIVYCVCGWSGYATPRHDRRIAGEVVPGWTIRVPAHDRSTKESA
jgi:hypothetical protein